MNWQVNYKGRVKPAEPLKKYTTFKIGGRADFFAQPKDEEGLKSLLVYAKKSRLPVLILGAGSNILASDKRVKAMVVKLDSPLFRKIAFRGNRIEAGSGILLGRLLEEAKKRALSGAEFLAGIPGTLGGALFMNAGAWAKEVSDLVEKVRVMDYNGRLSTLRKKQIKFGYRSCGLEKFIILEVVLKLARGKRSKIKDGIARNLAKRRLSQDAASFNAGCIFKNPSGDSAGRLIDRCALKGKAIGGAYISRKHANFILNRGDARQQDVLRLMQLAKNKVKDKFGVNLEPEIKIWR